MSNNRPKPALNLAHIEEWPLMIKCLVVVGTAVIIIFLGYFLGGMMQSKKINVTQTYYKNRQRLYKRKYKELSTLQVDADRLKAVDLKLMQLRKTLPAKTAAPALLRDIQSAGYLANIHILSFKPMPLIKSNDISIAEIDINALADFHQAGDFISRIANLKQVVVLNKMTLTTTSDEHAKGRQAFKLRLAFYHPEKTQLKDAKK
jgi:Tfp pilus assembly protein PilO